MIIFGFIIKQLPCEPRVEFHVEAEIHKMYVQCRFLVNN